VPATPCCTCMTAIGSSSPRADKQFKRVEVHAGIMLPGNKQESSPASIPASRWSPTFFSLEATLEAQ
jgi:hypothetical protein